MPDRPGLRHLGGRIDDAAEHPVGPDAVPLDVAGIDRGKPRSFERTADLVKVPPGNAVDPADHGGRRLENRCKIADDGRQAIRVASDLLRGTGS